VGGLGLGAGWFRLSQRVPIAPVKIFLRRRKGFGPQMMINLAFPEDPERRRKVILASPEGLEREKENVLASSEGPKRHIKLSEQRRPIGPGKSEMIAHC
jgi:hypothetical protein